MVSVIERALTIKRVATVVSNYQENASAEDLTALAQGCGRNCLGSCCLPDYCMLLLQPVDAISQLPLYAFNSIEQQSGHDEDEGSSDGKFPRMSYLNSLLLGQWEDCMTRGLFRYDVTTCETKIIPGTYSFIAQLNEGRHLKKRPTEFRVDKVLQPFDKAKFNFTKVGQEEVLFRFEPSKDDNTLYFPCFPVQLEEGSPSVIAINVSPIEYGHVLLIPHVLDCLPQKIVHDGLFLAICFAKEASDPCFRVGYNSLGAFATINHLHFQAYYLSAKFPIEKAPTPKQWAAKKLGWWCLSCWITPSKDSYLRVDISCGIYAILSRNLASPSKIKTSLSIYSSLIAARESFYYLSAIRRNKLVAKWSRSFWKVR